jgi:hypothetical protein
MRRKHHIFGALVVSLALVLGGLPSIARASTTVGLAFTFTSTDYSCVGPCAAATSYSGDGIAHTGSKVFGTMTFALAGTNGVFNPITNCESPSENDAFTTQKGKNTIFLSTTSDTYCLTANPNISLESGTLTITGGTGLFSNASGGGTFNFTVLTHPQTATDTFNLTITY